MRTSDAYRCAVENLSEHKLRSALTMLGMMFGVGAVIAMLSVTVGLISGLYPAVRAADLSPVEALRYE